MLNKSALLLNLLINEPFGGIYSYDFKIKFYRLNICRYLKIAYSERILLVHGKLWSPSLGTFISCTMAANYWSRHGKSYCDSVHRTQRSSTAAISY